MNWNLAKQMYWDHIENDLLRNLLTNGWDGDEDTICQALCYSSDAVAADVHNELLDSRIVEARAATLADAEAEWNEEGDGFATVDRLRDLWTI